MDRKIMEHTLGVVFYFVVLLNLELWASATKAIILKKQQ